jgi:hypothetical protein
VAASPPRSAALARPPLYNRRVSSDDDDDDAPHPPPAEPGRRRPGAVLGTRGPLAGGLGSEDPPPAWDSWTPASWYSTPGPDGQPIDRYRRSHAAQSRQAPPDLVDLWSAPRLHPASSAHPLAALAPRTAPILCSPGQYEALLESYRGWVAATTVIAIAAAWDSGRLSYSSPGGLPFESEAFSLIGQRAGLARPQIIEALAALDQANDRVDAARADLAGRPSPFDVFCAEHGVTRYGTLVLLLVAAPAAWGETARAYAILGNDMARATCDQHLLWLLLGHTMSRRDIARELDPSGALVRQGIVRIEGARQSPYQGLTVGPSVIAMLGGSPRDTDVEPGIARVAASVQLDRFMGSRSVIDRALADLATAPPGLGRVVVRGGNGSGRRTLLAALAPLAGRTLAMIDATPSIRDNRLRALAELLQRAHLRGWLPCVDGLDAIGSEDHAARAAVRDLLRTHPGPLAVRLARHAQPPLEPGYVLVDLPTSTLTERAAQWRTAAAEAGIIIEQRDELAARFAVGPGVIRNVVTAVARSAPPDIGRAIDSALRQRIETKLGTVATRVPRLASWSQLVLPSAIEDSVAELIARVRHRRTVYDTWGFDQVVSSSRGLTALLQGGPGTGKTMLASALANELGLDLYRVDLARVMSKWIGETEQNLATVFDAAEQGQVMILFDEADSLFGQRTEVHTSLDRYANLEINYLLQRLDTFEGIAVLTTNLGAAIDAAFRRRLTCCLTLPFPDAAARERLWRVHLPEQLPISGPLDLAGLARRYEMSGGYIRNAALRAAFLAAHEQTSLSQFHLERAIRAEFSASGKLPKSGPLE